MCPILRMYPSPSGCLEFPFHGNPRSVLASGSVPGREALSFSLSLSPFSRVSIRPLAGCNVFEAFAIAKRERSKLPPPSFAHLTCYITRTKNLWCSPTNNMSE